jgi:Na+:H+ antiporter, NhaA family
MRTFAHMLNPPAVAQVRSSFGVRLFRSALNRFLLLPIGVIVALVWANTEPEAYFRFSHAAAFPVNEIGMAIFLALIAQELYEALLPGGALATWRHRALPGFAAIGGLVGAVASYLMLVRIWHEQVLASAWPVVAAVDIAAGYYVLRLIYPRRRSTAASFLLLTAVLTDSIVISVVSVQTPSFAVHPAGLGLFAVALASAAFMRRQGVASFWPYWLVSGTLSWLALYGMGIHPALALVPIVPLLPHDRRAGELFADRLDDEPVHHAEHQWNGAAQVALFLFGLVNGGVMLRHVDTGSWAVLLAAVIGRPLGVLAAVALAIPAGFKLPPHFFWKDVAVVALATTSGFTFALFLGAATLPIGAVAEQVTLGALMTVIGALLAVATAWILRVGRFKARG